MYEAGSVTAMLYLILMAAPIFTYFINLARVPEALVHWIDGHQFPPLGVIFTLTAVYILLGTFFEEMSSILITCRWFCRSSSTSATTRCGGV